MRSAFHRTSKYDKKVGGLVLDSQRAGFASALKKRMEIEKLVGSMNVGAVMKFSYIAFGEELIRILKTHKAEIAATEACIACSKWIERGLDKDALKAILKAMDFFCPALFAEEKLYERNEGATFTNNVFGANYVTGQTFTIGSTGPNEDNNISKVAIQMARFADDEPGIITARLKAVDGTGKPTGPDLSTGTTSANTLPVFPNAEWREITMTSYKLEKDKQYAITLEAPVYPAVYVLLSKESASPFPGGTWVAKSDGGWVVLSEWDLRFKQYGIGPL